MKGTANCTSTKSYDSSSIQPHRLVASTLDLLSISMTMPPHPQDPIGKPTTVVLRTSCDACREVKMACSRGKPTCARCARRGEVCVYGPMKRAGRKKQHHDFSQPQAQEHPQAQSLSHRIAGLGSRHMRQRSNNTRTPLSSPRSSISIRNSGDPMSSTQPLALNLLTHVTGDPFNGHASDITLPPENMENALADQSPRRNSGHTLDRSPDAEGSSTTINTSGIVDMAIFTPQDISLEAFDESDWMLLSPIAPEANVYTPPLSAGLRSNPGSTPNPPNTTPSGDCMSLALSVLGALTPPLEICLHESNNLGASKSANTYSFDDVMQRNLASIDSINPILNCTCAVDSNVVLTLAHIIFQILAWYTAAAGVTYTATCLPLGQRTQLPQVLPPTASSLPGYDLNEEGTQDRAICQIVLSRMHSVRTLVDGLSRILLREDNRPTHSCIGGKEMDDHMDCGLNSSPISPSILAISLESELRRCLRDVSRAIVAKLVEV